MKQRLLMVILTLAVLSLACYMPVAPRGTPTPLAQSTDLASTLAARVTQTGESRLATLTPADQATIRPTFTQPVAAATLSPTATVQLCDQAQFIADVTIPDGTKMTPGQVFTKTWRLRNIGTCTWTRSYAMVFTAGDAMGAPAVVNLPGDVSPGSTVDLSINLRAPNNPGKYNSDWKLRNAAGQLFGIYGDQPFFAQIEVVSSLTPTVTTSPTPTVTAQLTITPSLTPPVSGIVYDFSAGMCKAEWRSLVSELNCPGSTADAAGYVIRLENPRLETGANEDDPVILTHPQQANDGAITGRFPPVAVQNGYHFLATLGCLSGANNCSVIYQLNYSVDGGAVQNLGQWQQTYDSSIQGIDVNLSSLAGKNVQLILVVLANGPADQDQALWIYPRIVKQ